MPASFGASFGFVNAPLGKVADELFTWRSELDFDPTRVDLPGGLVENAAALLPIARSPIYRDLLVATIGDRWTAYFNAFPSGDPVGPTDVLGRRLKVPVVQITAHPFRSKAGATDEPLGGLLFSYKIDPNDRSEPARSIAVVEGESSSSRYHFEQWGPVQPWEESERYTAR
ncbi:MAG: hypothetical protein LBH76_07090, partial [Propionibacteriaceae bacterium]|nr:hypothetical protein [Propionibacteriaceae bacterium]